VHLYPRVFVIPCCRHTTHRTESCQLESTLPGQYSEQEQTFNMQLLTTDVRQLVACLVWRHVGVQGTQILTLRPRNTAQWCVLLSAALDVSVRAFGDSRRRLSGHSNNAGSTAVTPTQGAAASERSTVHPRRPVDTVRASTAHTAVGWATATGLSCKERHFHSD